MAYTHFFDPIAATEYEEAFIWYEKESFVAADNFIIRLQEAIAAACADPYRYRNAYKNFREIPLKKYPYHLIYWVDEPRHTIVIVSVFHQKRHPKKKYEK